MIDIIIFQAIFRKFAETGGIPLLAQNPHIHGFLQMVYSLPLCPPNLVGNESMILLRDEINLNAHDNDDLQTWLTNFLLFVERTWITGKNTVSWTEIILTLLQCVISPTTVLVSF